MNKIPYLLDCFGKHYVIFLHAGYYNFSICHMSRVLHVLLLLVLRQYRWTQWYFSGKFSNRRQNQCRATTYLLHHVSVNLACLTQNKIITKSKRNLVQLCTVLKSKWNLIDFETTLERVFDILSTFKITKPP